MAKLSTFIGGNDNKQRQFVDIGAWLNYQYFIDKEQIALQRKSLNYTGVYNKASSDICFIYTKLIHQLNEQLERILPKIRVVDAKTIIEDEVFYTTKIEGARTTRVRTSELHNGAPINASNRYSEQMVVNSFNATKYLNLVGSTLSEDVIVQTWNILIKDACENSEIRGSKYRDGAVFVGSFEAPSYKDVPELMKGFIRFYNSREMEDIPIVKAALVHYAFETIHPFCDGNGRLGRMLLSNYLISRGYEAVKAVSISRQIDKTRAQYDLAFTLAENIYNDCTPFLEYMLNTMYIVYSEVLERQKLEKLSRR